MTTERIKQIQEETAHPNSVSVQQALLKVWNECQQENNKELEHLRKINAQRFEESKSCETCIALNSNCSQHEYSTLTPHQNENNMKDTIPTKEELLKFSNEWSETFEGKEKILVASAHYSASCRMRELWISSKQKENKTRDKYETILQRKIDYYGETRAAYQFAAEEYATQCQQDNAEKEYTKKQMIDFAFNTYCYISGIMKVPFNQISENKLHAEDSFEYFLTTLNKQ